jgi:hypothetical protein
MPIDGYTDPFAVATSIAGARVALGPTVTVDANKYYLVSATIQLSSTTATQNRCGIGITVGGLANPTVTLIDILENQASPNYFLGVNSLVIKAPQSGALQLVIFGVVGVGNIQGTLYNFSVTALN